MHLDLDHAVALTRLAATPFYIKAKAPWLIPACSRFLSAGKEFAHGGKDAGIRRWIRSRGAADRALIYIDYLVEQLEALYRLVFGCC